MISDNIKRLNQWFEKKITTHWYVTPVHIIKQIVHCEYPILALLTFFSTLKYINDAVAVVIVYRLQSIY